MNPPDERLQPADMLHAWVQEADALAAQPDEGEMILVSRKVLDMALLHLEHMRDATLPQAYSAHLPPGISMAERMRVGRAYQYAQRHLHQVSDLLKGALRR